MAAFAAQKRGIFAPKGRKFRPQGEKTARGACAGSLVQRELSAAGLTEVLFVGVDTHIDPLHVQRFTLERYAPTDLLLL